MRRARLLALLLGSVAVVFGCGRGRQTAPPQPSSPAPTPQVDFAVRIPCVISTPIQRVLVAYQDHHAVYVETNTDKPLGMLGKVKEKQTTPTVVFTMGEVEMQALVVAGAVDKARVVDMGRNAYQIAAMVPSGNDTLHSIADLARPAVKKVAIEEPKLSTLGNRCEQALRKLGLWTKIAPKVVRFDPTVNLLDQLLEGKADAAIVYRDCLFSEGGSPPKTVRLLASLPVDSYAPIIYQAAPLKQAPASPQADAFLAFLKTPEGVRALQQAGLAPKTP